ncbi:helicase-exonuclease AddAB subunit AddB [Shouchella sp. JSM 1781072]|uniref:helicase-exonuclease AddAB subunit AddB n=1 Tax=Shouchella sp. JSM 1781072 TaxID=3344581 RepID=UPI0035C0A463
MIHFYLGRSGSGKSTKMKEEIMTYLNDAPADGPEIILLVPDQMSFQVEYDLAKKTGGFSRLSVLSLHSLAERILDEAGQRERPMLDRTGMHVLIKKIIEQKKDQLRVFKRASNTSGFVKEMEQMILELRRQELSPDQIHVENETLSLAIQDKMHDVKLIFREFEETFSNRFWDKEEQVKRAIKAVPDVGLLKGAYLYIDGFYEFSKLERRFLTALCDEAATTKMALTLDEHLGQADTFYLTNETYELMVQSLQQHKLRYKEEWFKANYRFNKIGLASLEEALVHQDHDVRENDHSVKIVETVNRRVEIESVAKSIRSLVREQGYRYTEIAVVTRDLHTYSDLIRRVFPTYEVPFFLDDTHGMIQHQLIELIRSSFEAVMQRYPYEALFRAFKTDLFIPLDEEPVAFREKIDELENVVLAQGIKGNLWSTARDWQLKTARHGFGEDPTEEELENNATMNWLKNLLIAPLNQFESNLKRSETISDMCHALYTFLLALSIPEKMNQLQRQAEESGYIQVSSEYSQVWEGVLSILDQLVDIGGEDEVTVSTFFHTLNAGFENMSFKIVPPAIDQVTVGDMERSRLPKPRATFIVGVNEGIIPSRPREKGMISEQERMALQHAGLSLGHTATDKLWHEAFYAYMSQTSASEALIVSYALADEEGASLLPSPLIRHIHDSLNDVETVFVQNEPEAERHNQAIEYISHPKQAMSQLIRQLQKWKQGEEIDSIWWDVYNWFRTHAEWQRPLKSGLESLDYSYTHIPLTNETTKDLYNAHLVMSVSRMELFKQCSFRHFSQYGLRLKERDVYRLEAFDIGELFHTVLKTMSEKQKDRNKTWKTLSYEECREMTSEAVAEVAPTIQREILMSTNHYQYITEKLHDIAVQVTEALRQQALLSTFETVELEVAFGPQNPISIPSYKLENGMSMTVQGRIDRIDQAERDGRSFLSVVDYKSSPTSLSFSDVIEGISLQMPVYLTVALKGSEAWLEKSSEVGGMFYFHLHNPVLEEDKNEDEQRLKAFQLNGWMKNDYGVAELFDKSFVEKNKSNVVPVEFKKDGSFHSRSKVLTDDQFQTLFTYTEQKIVDIGNEIVSGKTIVAPYQKENGQIACTYCPMQAVCQFDPSLPGFHYNELVKRKNSDALVEMQESIKARGSEHA